MPPSSAWPGVFASNLVEARVQDAIAQDARSIASLFRDFSCEHLYVDVGANLGLQMRKLYEPHFFHGADVEHTYMQLFGPPPRCNVCTISVEPNPLHADHLSRLHEQLRGIGVGALFFQAAASDADGEIDFFVGATKGEKSDADIGASASPLKARQQERRYGRSVRKERVRAIDLARLLSLVQEHMPSGGKVLMKLDIETLEMKVLPHLVWTRSLCTSVDSARHACRVPMHCALTSPNMRL